MTAQRAAVRFIGTALDTVFRACGLLFLVLGCLKLHGVIIPEETFSSYLALSNPLVFFLSNRAVLSLAGIAEITVGGIVLRRGIVPQQRAAILLWLSAVTLLYRFLLRFIDYHGPCGCLYGINRVLPLTTNQQRIMADILLIVTVGSSLLGVIVLRRFAGTVRNANCTQDTPSSS